MPAILDRLVSQLKAKGKSDAAAHAIAVSALQKSGNLKKGTIQATAKGQRRGAMSPADRAKDRAVKASGGKHSAGDFVYNSATNRVRVR